MSVPPGRMRRIWLLFAAALVLRIAAGVVWNVGHDGWVRGNAHYLEAAENLLAGRGYRFEWYFEIGTRWANRPPGFALWVAALRGLTGGSALAFVVAGSAVGASTVLATALLARRAAGETAALLAAAGVALHPYYVVNDSALSENALYTALMAWSVLLLWDFVARPAVRPALGLGVAFAVTAMMRVTWIATLPFAFVWALCWTPARARLAVLSVACIAPALLATCSPWLLRNYERFGTPVMAIDGGRALWNGHNPQTLSAYPGQSIDLSEKNAWYALAPDVRAEIVAAEDEAVADSMFRAIAMENIRSDAGAAVHRTLVKIGAFLSPDFNPGPAGASKRLAHALFWLLTLPPLLVALCRPRAVSRRLTTLGVALLLGALLPSAVFWGQTRFRVPVDWLLLAVTAALVADLVGPRCSRPATTDSA